MDFEDDRYGDDRAASAGSRRVVHPSNAGRLRLEERVGQTLERGSGATGPAGEARPLRDPPVHRYRGGLHAVGTYTALVFAPLATM